MCLRSTGDGAPANDIKVKTVSPIFGELINGVSNVADALLKGGVDITDNAVGGGSAALSAALKGEDTSALMSTILEEVDGAISQATAVVADVVSAATSIAGALLSEASSPSNIRVLASSRMTSTTNGTALTQLQATVTSNNTSQSRNVSDLNLSPASFTVSTPTTRFVFESISCLTIPPPVCPGPQTVTCTETWHSTHYAATATIFSFMSVMTVTSREIVR